MSVLVAGIGNVFFGDDGFGVEVARRLALDPPPGTRVVDFGIRAIHFAFELLSPVELCIVADCMPRRGTPGSLYVVEPALEPIAGAVADAHGMNLPLVFAAVRDLGGRMPPTRIVGCEPGSIEPGIGLGPAVTAAIPRALDLVRELALSQKEKCA